jgi:hypothetical protein
MLNVLGGISLAAAASAHMTRMAAAQFLVTSFGSRPAEIATTEKPDQPEMLNSDIR